MKVDVVTGANGFIGKAVTKELLRKGDFVYAVVTDSKGMDEIKNDNLRIVPAFFEDYPSLPDKFDKLIDVWYHFAWQGVWGPAFKDYKLQLSNAAYARMAIEVAKKSHASKFVLASTVNVLETKKKISIQGPQPLRYTTNYAMSKLTAEMLCKTFSENEGICFNCAYLAMAYGPGNGSLMVPNVVICKLMQGISPDLVEGNGLYDLIYVDDIAKGFVAIGERGLPMKSYYLGHSALKSFRNLFMELGKIVNPNVPLNFGVYPDDNQLDYSQIDLNELEKDTGFVPSSDFRQSVLSTMVWLKEHDFLGVKK
jgi:nucleoside-diphosphate-sugar epimerase